MTTTAREPTRAARTLDPSSPGLRATQTERELLGTSPRERKRPGPAPTGHTTGVVSVRLPLSVIAALRAAGARLGREVATEARERLVTSVGETPSQRGPGGAGPGVQVALPGTEGPTREEAIAQALALAAKLDEVEAQLGIAQTAAAAGRRDLAKLEKQLGEAEREIAADVTKIANLERELQQLQGSQAEPVMFGGSDRRAAIGEANFNARNEGRVVVATVELPRAKAKPAARTVRGWVPSILPSGVPGKGVEVQRVGDEWRAVDDGRDMTEAVERVGLCSTPDVAKSRAQGKVTVPRW